MNNTNFNNSSLREQASLLILGGEEKIKIIPFESDITMGRENSDLILKSSIVSRHHGLFFIIGGEYWYRDFNSLNGTYVNGVKLNKEDENWTEAVRLRDGDILRIDRISSGFFHPEAVVIVFNRNDQTDDVWNSFSLSGFEEVSIGRHPDNAICLNDFTASRNHALLKKFDGHWVLIDCESKNGISVNGSQVEEYIQLRRFDVIRIARITIIFLEDEVVYNEITEDSMAGINPVISPEIPLPQYRMIPAKTIMSVNLAEVAARRSVLSQKKVLLRDIRFDIEAGDFTLILGGAGAGKSTLIKAITGQVRSTGQNLFIEGNVVLDGLDLYKNLKSLKHRIGIVPQYPDYRVNDTVYHTIMDAAKIQLAGEYSRKEIEDRVESVIQKMILTSIRDSELGVISGGQRKRVQVAIKAIGDISFFTFDEPDAGLDVAGRIDQMNQLTAPITRNESVSNSFELQQCTASGNAGLMISHYPDDVAHMYKKVIVLAKSSADNAGHLAYYGSVPDALEFFGVNKLSEIVLEINSEGGKGRGDEFIRKFENMRRGF